MYVIILTAHVFTTFFMTGLCWFVQLVHYPLFKDIPLESFPSYQKKNYRTAIITVPIMIIEMISGLWIIYYFDSWFFITNIILFGLILLSTLIFQIPTHLSLKDNPNLKSFNFLIRSNWIRTILWTVRSGMLIYLLFNMWFGAKF